MNRDSSIGGRTRALAGAVRSACLLLSTVCLLVSTACRRDMHTQPRYNPEAASTFFDDGRSERPVISGTVARTQLRTDEAFYTGKMNGVEVSTFPFPITQK